MLFLSWNKSKEETKRKKETKTRNQKKAKQKDKKKGRKERKRERPRKKKWKRGRPKKAMEKERETLKNKQKRPFLGGKAVFSSKNIERKGPPPQKLNKNKKTNKESLGTSEVALWATSHVLKPSKKQQTKKNKIRKKETKNNKNQKILKHELFSYQSNFSFLGGCPKFPFFDNLAQKERTLKTL